MPRPRLPGPAVTALRTVGTVALVAAAQVRERFQQAERRSRTSNRDGGYSTETVLVIALLVALAIVVIGIIANLVIDRANSIEL